MGRCETKDYQAGDLVVFTNEGNHPFGFEGIGTIVKIDPYVTMFDRPGYVVEVNGQKRGFPYWDEDLNPAFARSNKEAKRLLKR